MISINDTLSKLVSFATGQAFNKPIFGAIAGSLASGLLGKVLGGDDDPDQQAFQQQTTTVNPFSAGGGLFNTNFGPGFVPGGFSPQQPQGFSQGGQGGSPNVGFGGIRGLTGGQPTQTLPQGTGGFKGAPGLFQQPQGAPASNALTMSQFLQQNPNAGRQKVLGQSGGKAGLIGGGGGLAKNVNQNLLQRQFAEAQSAHNARLQAAGVTPVGAGAGVAPGTPVDAAGNPLGSQQPGGFGLNLGISDPTLQGINQQGLQGAQGFLDQSINNQTADLAGQQGFDFLNALGSSDPLEVAQNQFDLLNPILQDQQQEDFLGLENRLFQQGRTGGAGQLSGQNDLQTLFDSQQDAERKLLFDSLGQGLQSQQQQFNIGSGLSQLDPALRGSFQNLGSGMLNIPLQLQQAMLSQAQVAGGLAGNNTGTSINQQGGGSLSPTQTIGAGLLNSGVQGLTNSANSFFNSAGGGGGPFNAFDNSINGFTNTVGR